MDRIQKLRREYKLLPKGYYHLCSDGWRDGLLFHNERHYASGVTSIALMTIKFDVSVYAYVLMPNHIHLILSGTGAEVIKAYDSFIRRCSALLRKDDCSPLPDDYGFKLIPIESKESLRSHFLYLARNPYEKGYCIPGSYPWGSDCMIFNRLFGFVKGEAVGRMSHISVVRITNTLEKLPDHWEIHPVLGILPQNFIKNDKLLSLFESPKAYISQLVKDYERHIYVSTQLEENFELSEGEINEIVSAEARQLYPGKTIVSMDNREKYLLAVKLNRRLGLTAQQLGRPLRISEYSINQALNAKEFR